MSLLDAHAVRLRQAGFRGKTLDCAALLLEAQVLIDQIEFGRVTLHIGSNKVTLNVDRQVSHRRWGTEVGHGTP